MSGQNHRAATSYACAFCGEPLVLTKHGIKAWRVGNEFVCNEFCADGVPASDKDPPKIAPAFGRSVGVFANTKN